MAANLDLPQGFSIVEEDEEEEVDLPEGFSIVEEDETPPSEEVPQSRKGPYETPYDVSDERIARSKDMSVAERMELAQDLKTEREFRQSKGGTKGFLSGATFGLTENIPGFEYEEGDLAFGAGKTIGAFAPMTGLFKAWGIPIQAANEYYNLGVAGRALTNVLQATGVGMTESAIEDAFKGEVPDPIKMMEKGAEWGAMDMLFQLGGATGRGLKAFFKAHGDQAKAAWNSASGLIDKFTKNKFTPASVEENTAKVFQETAEYFGSKEAQRNIQNARNQVFKEKGTEKFFGDRISTEKANSQNLKNRKVNQDFYQKQREKPKSKERPEIAEPRNPQEPVTESELDLLADRPESKQALGETVKDSVNDSLKLAEEQYKPMYQMVTEEAGYLEGDTNNIVNRVWDRIERLRAGGLNLKPAQYKEAEDILTKTLKDLGGAVTEMSESGVIEGVAGSEGPQQLSKLMEVYQRLKHHARYDVLEKDVKDLVTQTRDELKQVIKKSLEKDNPAALEMLETADQLFQQKSENFSNDFIRRVRSKNTKPETIAGAIETGSDLQKLKKVVSPEVFQEVERELLSSINSKSWNQANAKAREVRKYLSDDANVLLDEILLSKKPKAKLTAADRDKLKENWVLKRMASPTRPDSLIADWKTEVGRKTIERSLKNNPNKEGIIEYLKNESFADFANEVVTDTGKINFERLENISASGKRAIEDVGGEGAVTFFENLDKTAKRAKQQRERFNSLKERAKEQAKGGARGTQIINEQKLKNDANRFMNEQRKKLARIPIEAGAKVRGRQEGRGEEIINNVKAKIDQAKLTKFDKIEDWYKNSDDLTKQIGLIAGISTVGTPQITFKVLQKLAKSPRLRYALNEMTKVSPSNPYKLYGMIQLIDEIAREEDED